MASSGITPKMLRVLDTRRHTMLASRVEEGGTSKESAKPTVPFRKGAKRAEAVGRWRASRKLARKLLEQLVQYDVDAARETCYVVVMQLDALQRGARDAT